MNLHTLRPAILSNGMIGILVLLLSACTTMPTSKWRDNENRLAEQVSSDRAISAQSQERAAAEKAKKAAADTLAKAMKAEEILALNSAICVEKDREGIFLDLKGKPAVRIEKSNSRGGIINPGQLTSAHTELEDDIWTLTFRDATNFVVASAHTKQSVEGNIRQDFVLRPDGSKAAIFQISQTAWSGTWVAGDTLEIRAISDVINVCLEPASSKSPAHEEGGFRVKYLNKPILAIIDELAYKRRFSYTVHSDLSPYIIDIYDESSIKGTPIPRASQVKQRYFRDEREIVDFIVNAVNKKYFSWNEAKTKKLAFSWDSDGPRFYVIEQKPIAGKPHDKQSITLPVCSYGISGRLENGTPINQAQLIGILSQKDATAPHDYCGGFKKIFLNNITSGDANLLISTLFTGGEADGINANNKRNMALSEYKYQNALILRSGDADLLKQIGSLIYAYDSESPQILIEAFVYQYTEQIGRVIGSALEVSQSADPATVKTTKLTTLLGTAITSSLPQLFFNMTSADQRRSLIMTLAAQDKEGLVKIVAEPKLVSKSGSDKASIKLTQKKFIEIRGVNAAELKEVEAGLELKITPTILGGDNVLLTVNLNQSEFIPTTETQVLQATNVNQIEVELIVKDGELTSLGAVESTRVTDFGSGLAGVKDLGVRNNPLLGLSDQSSNALRVEFMIRPHIRFMRQKISDMNNAHLLKEYTTR